MHYFRDDLAARTKIPRVMSEAAAAIKNRMKDGDDLEAAIQSLDLDEDMAREAWEIAEAARSVGTLSAPGMLSVVEAASSARLNVPGEIIDGLSLPADIQTRLEREPFDRTDLIILRHRLGISRTTEGAFYLVGAIERMSQTEIGEAVSISQVHISRKERQLIKRLRFVLGYLKDQQ